MAREMNSNRSETIFVGNSEMAMLMRSVDWSQTLLGSISTWTSSLKTAVSICLNSHFPMVIWWGKDLVLLYNDAWRPILGIKHPKALGRPGQEVWSEIWDIIGVQLHSVLETAQATSSDDMLLLVDRYGYTEEAYFTYSYSPIFLETGEVGGAFTAVTETTRHVIGKRRLSTLRELAANTVEAKSVEETCRVASATLANNPHDIPFALLYLVEQDGKQARLVQTVRVEAGTSISPEQIDLNQEQDGWKFAQVKKIGNAEIVDELTSRFGVLSGGAWDEPSRAAIVLPIPQAGQKQLAGLLVLGISPHREFDDEYRGFFDLAASYIATAITNANAYEAERKQTGALAELDRAKTTFLSISHELPSNRVSTILESITDAFVAFDDQWRYTYVNEQATRILHKTREELLGKQVWEEVFPNRVGTHSYQELQWAATEQVPVVYEDFNPALDVWFEVRAYPSSEGLAVYFHDISDRKRSEAERKQAEQALRDSEERFRQLTENIDTVFFMSEGFNDASPGRVVYVSPAYERIWGRSCESLYENTRSWFEAIHLDDQERVQQALPGLAKAEFDQEFRIVRPDGAIRWVHDRVFPVYNERGEVYRTAGIVEDVTERKQAEAALRLSEERYRSLVTVTSSIVWVAASDGAIVSAPAWEDITGQTPEEYMGWGWFERLHPEDREPTAAIWAEALQHKTPCEAEYRLLHRDGQYRYGLARGVPILDEAGEVREWIGTLTDITERKQAEEALRGSEERLRLALKSAALGAWDFNPITNVLKWDDQCKVMFGLSPHVEVDYDVFLASLHPEDRERIHQAVLFALSPASDGEVDIEYRTVGIEDGVERWIAAKGKAFFNQTGLATRLIGTVLNITERKQAEAEREHLLAQERHYVSQLQGLTSAALAINSALSIEQVLQVITHQAASIIGTHQSVTSMTIDQNWAQAITDIYMSDKYAQWRDYDEKPDGSGIYACVCHLNHPMRMTQTELEAHPRWQGFSKATEKHPPMRGWLAAPLVGRDGQNMGLIQLSDKYEGDFTEADEAILVQLAQMASVAVENAQLYEAEQQARSVAEASREEAQAANRIKDEFLAVLSHELRSPLNPILGWSRLLQSGKLDEAKTKQALATIERNAKLQSELIEDLLDVSRILQGKLSLNINSVNLASTIKAAIETVRLAAEAKSIQIQTMLDPEVRPVSGDLTRLQQVVWNLLSNAVKFTPAGGRIELRLDQVEIEHAELSMQNELHSQFSIPSSQSSYAQITVSDTGTGISPRFLPHVFDYFRQEDGATTRKFGGLGLGLAIVRHLVELHGGTIQAESPGEDLGATFTVRLPLMANQPAVNLSLQSLEQPLDLKGTQVLIVDDDIDTRNFIEFLLKQAGAKVITTTSAKEALTVLMRSKPDVLLSDIGMPDMDGYMLMQ